MRSASCGSTAMHRGSAPDSPGSTPLTPASSSMNRTTSPPVTAWIRVRSGTGRCAAGAAGALVRHPEQIDHVLGPVLVADWSRDPTRVGQYVMRSRPAGRDQLIPDSAREREIGDPVAMEVAQLPAPKPELD